MIQTNFTPAGLQQQLSSLYSSPQSELDQEAHSLQLNFKAWMKAHFFLDEQQTAYLNGIDELFVERASELARYYVQNRLPISLNKMLKPESRSTDNGDSGKILDLDENVNGVYSPENGYEETSTLTFTISYKS